MKYSENSTSNWGQAWIDAIAKFTPRKQLERGRVYAKSNKVLSIHVDQGFAAAEVEGSRARPYKVEIGLPMFTQKQWRHVTDALLKKAFYTAKLLAGDMPREIEPIFEEAGAPLIPNDETDISSDCSCFDVDEPCKHIAAVYFLLGQEIERNPFLLMEMRGLTRAQLLTEIQTRRSARGKSAPKKNEGSAPVERPAQTFLSGRLNDFFQSPKTSTPPTAPTPDAASIKPGARIREMGTPPFWQSDNNFEDVLIRVYQAVRKRVAGQ